MNRKIDGTFFEFHHHNTPEGKYWNPAIDRFTGDEWREKVREIASLGMEYIVVMATALYDKCFFPSAVFPLADMPCKDPIEEILDERVGIEEERITFNKRKIEAVIPKEFFKRDKRFIFPREKISF